MKKKINLVMVFLALVVVTSYAQDSTKIIAAKEKALAAYNQAWSKLDVTLKLSPTQTQQWQDLNKKYAQQEKAIATNTSLSQTEKEAQLEALHTQKESELSGILTPAQMKEWAAIKKSIQNSASTKFQEGRASRQERLKNWRNNN